jgi:hypothetical protein
MSDSLSLTWNYGAQWFSGSFPNWEISGPARSQGLVVVAALPVAIVISPMIPATSPTPA